MPSAALPSASTVDLPIVLVVDDEPSLREVVEDLALRSVKCRVRCAATVAEARKILATEPIQLLVADVNLPDGNGVSLLALLQKHRPTASAIVITGAPTMDTAIDAMREGALDFVAKPFTPKQLCDSLRAGLERTAKANKQERRFDRLKTAVRRLNESRRMISRKVDLLCNDLVSAYGELSKQLDDVRIQEGFRKCIEGAADLEQLLCHAMDWLLRQLGYCNVAVYLAGEDGAFQLGAYMKYTLAGDNPLTDCLKRVLVPAVVREGVLHAPIAEFDKQLTSSEQKLLKGQDILGVNCTYLGEALAGVIFFRDNRGPFTLEDEALVRSVSAIFAIALASVVRDARPTDEEDGDYREDRDEDGSVDNGPRPKHDPADWWKTGGDSPF